jgi:hypothetical protein
MLKLVTFLTRRSDLTLEEFIHRYESQHRLIGEKYLRPYATRYVRRYCRPVGDDVASDTPAPPCDVVMEIWFPDRESFDRAMTDIMQPEAQKEIIADEETLFDRSKIISVIVEEYESNMSQGQPTGEPSHA